MPYDIAIVGGGPAGLSAAVNARARNKSVLVVSNDYRESPLYRAKQVDSPGPPCWTPITATRRRPARLSGGAGC